MSQFVSSIVRGAGFSIGRNLVGDFGRRNLSNSNRFYDRAENELEKAINFPIQGRSETILGKCFNVSEQFENQITSYSNDTKLSLHSSNISYYKDTIDKLQSCVEYLELKNPDDEVIDKIETLMDKITKCFSEYISTIVPELLGKNAGYVSEVWEPRLRPIYIQINPNDKIISDIDKYAKTYEEQKKKEEESLGFFGIAFLTFSFAGMIFLLYKLFSYLINLVG